MGWVGRSSGEGERRCLGDLSFERSGLIELWGGESIVHNNNYYIFFRSV